MKYGFFFLAHTDLWLLSFVVYTENIKVAISFLPKWEQNKIVWISKCVSMCKACGKLGGSGVMFLWGNFDFGPFIGRNLVESGTIFAQASIYCVIKAFIHVK